MHILFPAYRSTLVATWVDIENWSCIPYYIIVSKSSKEILSWEILGIMA